MAHPTNPHDGGTRLHPTGAIPRPRHPSGKPTITPIKNPARGESLANTIGDDEVPRATRSLYGSGAGGKAAGAKMGDWINRASPAKQPAPAARRAPEPAQADYGAADEDSDEEPDGRFAGGVDMNETWEQEAAEEMASDMWLDELEFRMGQVYERVGRQQQQWAESIKEAPKTAGEMGMTNAFEQDLVNDQQEWMQELEREIAAVYEGMGKPPPEAPGGASDPTPAAEEKAAEAKRLYQAKHAAPPAPSGLVWTPVPAPAPPPAPAAARAPTPSGSVSNLVDGLEGLRAVAEAEEERARAEAVSRSRREAATKRSEVELEEDRARAEAIARSRKEAEEQRLEARMRNKKVQAAKDLRQNQHQRVNDLREQVKDDEKKAADKQQAVSDIVKRLESKVKNKSFPQALEAFGIKVNREDCEGKRIPEADALAKAYKKAMVRFSFSFL